MYKYPERQRGCMVKRLDYEKLDTIVREILRWQFNPSGELNEDYKVARDLVVGIDTTKDDYDWRNLIVICSEGVGFNADDYGLIPIQVNLSGWSAIWVKVSTRVINTLITEEEVDLAEHIRTFGDRLESNFSIMYNLIQGKGAKAHA